MKVKEESEKVSLTIVTKLRPWHPVPSLHGKYVGKQWLDFIFLTPKSLQIVIAVMKLKDAYSLEGKL